MDVNEIKTRIQGGERVCHIAKELGIRRNVIYYWLKKTNFKPHESRFNHRFFSNIDTEDKSYWLGFLMADGCVSITQRPKVQIKLCGKDAGHLLKWHHAIRSTNRISWIKGKDPQSTHYSERMCEDLISLGCVPKKSLILKFPNINNKLIHHSLKE